MEVGHDIINQNQRQEACKTMQGVWCVSTFEQALQQVEGDKVGGGNLSCTLMHMQSRHKRDS